MTGARYEVRRFLQDAVYKAISYEPLLDYMRKTSLSRKTVVLMYHEIAEDANEIEAWTVVRKSDFIRQMEYLSDHFNVVSLEEAIHSMSNGSAEETGKPVAVVTFDDGYKGNRRVLLPLVESMKIPVTIFVSSRAVQDGIVYWYDRLINGFQENVPVKINLSHLSLGLYQINQDRDPKNWSEIERLLRDLKTLEPNIRERAVDTILKDLKAPQKGGGRSMWGPDQSMNYVNWRIVLLSRSVPTLTAIIS